MYRIKNVSLIIMIVSALLLPCACENQIEDNPAAPPAGTEDPAAPSSGPEEDGGDESSVPVIINFTLSGKALTDTGTIKIKIEDDGTAVAWIITGTPEKPDADSANWLSSAPAEFHIPVPGQYELYAWAKNAEGLLSKSSGPLAVEYVDGPAAGEIIITEIMANPGDASDIDGEWFEVYNTSGRTIDLHGCEVGSSGGNSFEIPGSLSINAGATLVFARSDAATAGLPAVDCICRDFSLSNSGDEITLTSIGGMVIDSVCYASPAAGVSSQLLPEVYNSADNDTPEYWTASTSGIPPANKDLGTPGSINESLPPATIFFHADWAEGSTGNITAGTKITFDYSEQRLPNCRAQHEGNDAWSITISYRLHPDGEFKDYILPLGANAGIEPEPIFIPAGTTQIEVFASSSDADGCSDCDSNLNNNYIFSVE